MPSNPLSTIDGAPAAIAVRPQLWIGARPTQEVRVRKDEGHRWHDDQYRRTLGDIKESLVERMCEVAIEACEAGIAGVIDTLVKSAAAEANAAEQTRARAEIEKAQLQAEITKRQSVIDGLHADLVLERDRLTCLRKQLDTAMAERTKLLATFQLLQRALSLGASGELEVESACRDGVMHQAPLQEVRIDKTFDNAPPLAGLAPAVEAQIALAEAHPEAVEDVKQMLEQVKAAYDLDANSNRSSAELVDSLTSRLRHALDVTVARSSLNERDATTLFEQQIDVMLDLTTGTSFGRHLSISAYAAREPMTSTQRESGTGRQTIA